MPSKPPRPCPTPGCPNLIEGPDRWCPPCTRRRQRHTDRDRAPAGRRGYGATWRKLRTMKLARSPGCEWPEGCTRAATDVDHIVPLAEGGTNLLENLRSLCHPHHSSVTQRWVNRGGRAGGPSR